MFKTRLPRSISSDTLFLVLVVGIIVALGVPRLGMSAFWDETKVYFRPLFSLYSDFFGYFSAPATVFDRPPGLHLLYLPFLWIFGPHIEIIRALDLIYFCAGLVFFYKSTSSRLTLAFIVLTPIVQVYSVQYTAETQMFALYSLFLYLLTFHLEKTWIIFVYGIFLGLVRETSLALIPAGAFYLYLRGIPVKRWWIICGPLVGFIAYLFSGALSSHITLIRGDIDLFRSPIERTLKLWEIFLYPYRIYPLIILSLIIFGVKKNWRRPDPLTGFCLVLTLAYVFVFSAHQIGIPRYFMAVFPFAVYFLLVPLQSVAKERVTALLVLVPPLLVNTTLGRNYQDTWDYKNVQAIHDQVIREVKKKWPEGSVVMTSWPFMEILKSDYAGYGKSKNYQVVYDTPGPDVIIYTDYPKQITDEELAKALKSADYIEKVFSFKDYHVRLYEKE